MLGPFAKNRTLGIPSNQYASPDGAMDPRNAQNVHSECDRQGVP